MYIVIMAGGSGTRFWPFSRKAKPKQFLKITGDSPMVVETWNRVKHLSDNREGLVVLGQQHLKEAKPLFDGENIKLLAEPVGRNTAPCIGLAAVYADYYEVEDPMIILPADHYIADVDSFLKSLQVASSMVRTEGIATLGIVPTRPETGYGYIHKGKQCASLEDLAVFEVASFVEKPDLSTAQQYLTSREYYWNSGIFIATPKVILREIEKHLPDLHKGLTRIKKTVDRPDFEKTLLDVYPSLPNISFDYGIMEKTEERVFVIPCECGWSDVGSWFSLYDLKKDSYDENNNLVEGDAFLLECGANFVSGKSGRFIACLGLENCLIVDTEDALLVADKSRSQDIRKVVEYLEKSEKRNLL